jgi:hypothetical protein
VGLTLGACAFATEDEVAQTDQDIVRGRVEHRYPQVVAVHFMGFNGFTQCTGTYVAPRVVVTAAHCVRNDQIPGNIFVYHGRDYLTDRASLPSIPPPGERSSWARVETAVANPAYDPGVNYPDIKVLFLDRELPFAPIPILRRNVSDSTRWGKIVGWGGSRALTADITQVEGAGIKRSANVRLLGTPTEADYHADDPNPGMLVPEIRADLLKTDGRDPRSNTCAGDSGGPLFVERHGRDHLAGVGFWTGLWCEDYAVFTRMDPFLDFYDSEIDRAGDSPITPRLECVEEAADGSLVAHYGYESANGLTVNIPYGVRNRFDRDTTRARPSAFSPGNNPFVFEVPLGAGQTHTWRVNPPGGPTTVVRADASSPRCDPANPAIVCGGYCSAALDAECADPGATHSRCMTDCIDNVFFFDYYFGCGAQFNAYVECQAGLSSDAANWDCAVPGNPPVAMSPACDTEFIEVLSCLGY